MAICIAAVPCLAGAQDRLEDIPGYDRYRKITDSMDTLVVGGTIADIHWSDGSSRLSFVRRGKHVTYDLENRRFADVAEVESEHESGRPARSRPGRGRQRDAEPSPDGRWIARCEDYNVVLERDDGGEAIKVTSLGSRKLRYGTASWVYGEELEQSEAMWWSPDSTKLAYYEFDETHVKDFFLLGDLTEVNTTVLTEGYPKAGDPNPIAHLYVYNVLSRTVLPIETGPDSQQYVYAVRFSPDGSSLLFNRMNRRQNVLEVLATDLITGRSHVIVREEQPTWQKRRPAMEFLEDNYRFIWETEAGGWKHFQLRDLGGKMIAELTQGDFPCKSIERVVESSRAPGGGILFYTAYSDTNPLNAQLHCVNLDGSGARQITTLPANHAADVSPDGQWIVDEYQTAEIPPTTVLLDGDGNQVEILADSDASGMRAMALQPPELFTFTAADGVTDLYGVLFKPSDFDPAKQYPLVISVYGGPESQSIDNRYVPARAACEFGFLWAEMDNRGTVNRGKAFESALFDHLGSVELDDQAAGVHYLAQRPYVDGGRVGIYGFSYGGYMSALAILKRPDVFHVAVAGGTVSDWRNYDTIYTERYMRTPQDNPDGYRDSSCLTYAHQLQGKLLLLHGMVDDNVHPTNLWQLADALQRENRRFDMMLFPDSGHGLRGRESMYRWTYFYQHLIAHPPSPRPEEPTPAESPTTAPVDIDRVTTEPQDEPETESPSAASDSPVEEATEPVPPQDRGGA